MLSCLLSISMSSIRNDKEVIAFQRRDRDTYKSSLIVEGFPNCVAVERSRLKQIIQTRVRFRISRSCCSFVGFVLLAWWRFKSVASRIARPMYSQLRSSSQRRAGTAYTAIRMYAWQSSTDFHPSMRAVAAACFAKCIAMA